MSATALPILLQDFFQHLRVDRALSRHTIAGYRDTIRLFVRFLSTRERCTIDHLSIDALTPDSILAFLAHLERERGNKVVTRNIRLTAIRGLAKFTLGRGDPDIGGNIHRILAVPWKRTIKPVLGFLTVAEVKAVLDTFDLKSWIGRRDHLLYSLLYNTGARISEALQLKPSDVKSRVVGLHGKGRRDRSVPIWPQTQQAIQRWCRENKFGSGDWLFPSPDGEALSRRSAARRLALAIQAATPGTPMLKGRRISPHTFRHTTAMHLLQADVPLEIISLWLGHEQVNTTHRYIEADMTLKRKVLSHLNAPSPWRRPAKHFSSNLMSYLESL